MDSKKLSMAELKKLSRNWAKEINALYTPDLVVFIAKSGFIIAKEFSEFFNVPLQEIAAHRQGGNLRKYLAPIFSKFPLALRNSIVGNPIMYKINGRNDERNIEVSPQLQACAEEKIYKKILLIDDSIDTGWTFKQVFEEMRRLFPESEIRTLALIRMHYAKERFDVDFALYEDTLLLTPAQVDHEEHASFIEDYNHWRRNTLNI